MLVMGISCYYHDSAVAVVDDREIIFAIQEERLSRVKHDPRFPVLAIGHALEACGIGINDLDQIVGFFEDKNGRHGFLAMDPLEVDTPVVPLPSTLMLLGSGLFGLGAWRARWRKN